MMVSEEDLAIIRELDAAFLPSIQSELSLFSEDEEKKYELLQDAIKKYKEGNREAAEYIIKRFHPFLSKFAKYIKYNQIPSKVKQSKDGKKYKHFDSSIRSFIYLYVTATEVQQIMDKHKCKKETVFWYVREKIVRQFESYSYTDIYNELTLALLNMANKYKITKEGDKYHKKNGTFHMYVQRCFHFEAKRFLDNLTKDTMEHCIQVPLIQENHEGEEQEQLIEDERANISFVRATETASRDNMIKRSKGLVMKEFFEVDAYDEDCLNFNWTSGVTCSEVFKTLSPIEREIIVLIYMKNMPLVNIAKIYGTSKDTVKKYHKNAINKIKENLQHAS